MNFGETIKKLRREKNMTQEQLADYLNITTQAVSKWETNLSHPDITLIPAICNIFNTSSDTLFGIDIENKEKRINEIINRAEECMQAGYYAKPIEQLREGLREFPNSYEIMKCLMGCLFIERDTQETEEKRIEMTKEIIRLGEKILAECTDDPIRHRTIQTLCYVYPGMGETEKAITLAEKMPNSHLSSESLLEHIYTGTKRYEFVQKNLSNVINDLDIKITCNSGPLDDGSRPHTTEECIVLRKKILAIYDVIFEDGNYGFFGQRIGWIYIDIAYFYAKLEDYDSVIVNLKIAAEYAVKYDVEYDTDEEYTCLLLRGQKFGGVWHTYSGNDCMHQLEEMKESVFDPIRQNKDFIEIEDKLKAYAKYR